LTRKVTREEYEAAVASFITTPEPDRARVFAVIEAYEKGRAHPDDPGEDKRRRARERRAKKKAQEVKAIRENRWRARADALFANRERKDDDDS
jgi:hypothetical protein